MTAASRHLPDDSPSFMVAQLDRLAAKETDEFRANVLLALSHVSKASDKTAADIADLKAKVKTLEDGRNEIHELRATNERQDREIECLRARVKGHEDRVKAAWWTLGKVAAAAVALSTAAWAVYERFSK